jgi:hypothetical protein
MNDNALDYFRLIADAMQTESTDWQWVGPYMSMRHFGITKTRAEVFAARHGGIAQKMEGGR